MLEALRESEGKFEALSSNRPTGIVLADEQGIIVEWNQARSKSPA